MHKAKAQPRGRRLSYLNALPFKISVAIKLYNAGSFWSAAVSTPLLQDAARCIRSSGNFRDKAQQARALVTRQSCGPSLRGHVATLDNRLEMSGSGLWRECYDWNMREHVIT